MANLSPKSRVRPAHNTFPNASLNSPTSSYVVYCTKLSRSTYCSGFTLIALTSEGR